MAAGLDTSPLAGYEPVHEGVTLFYYSNCPTVLKTMPEETHSQEKRVLMVMRKTLARIIRDLTPADSAVRYPLSDETVEDIKLCFDLIAARERELAQAAGLKIKDKPHFVDEPKTTSVVSIQALKQPRPES